MTKHLFFNFVRSAPRKGDPNSPWMYAKQVTERQPHSVIDFSRCNLETFWSTQRRPPWLAEFWKQLSQSQSIPVAILLEIFICDGIKIDDSNQIANPKYEIIRLMTLTDKDGSHFHAFSLTLLHTYLRAIIAPLLIFAFKYV